MVKNSSNPIPSQPIYSTPSANSPIELYCGRMVLDRGTDRLEGDGSLSLEWLPSVGLRFRFRCDLQTKDYLRMVVDWPNDDDCQLGLGEASTTYHSVLPLRLVQADDGRAEFSGIVNGEAVEGETFNLSSLVFHLSNVPILHLCPDRFVEKTESGAAFGHERLVLRHDKWIVSLDPVENIRDLILNAKATRGYAITWVGKLECQDGTVFDLDEARRFLGTLDYLFAFAFERWCSPTLPVGLDQAGQPKCRVWGPAKVSPFYPSRGWFDPHHPGILADLLPRYAYLCTCEERREWFNDAIYWFVESHRLPVHAETSIVLGQITLEMMGWAVLVEEHRQIQSKKFDKMNAADKLRSVLEHYSVPQETPKELPFLSQIDRDGPKSVTSIRNSIVHRHRKNRNRSKKKGVTGDALNECVTLLAWYIEVAMLRELGYSGNYSNRLTQRYVGKTEPLPSAHS